MNFEEEIKKDYEYIKNYLPYKCNNILDVGCGIGGIDIMLMQHYRDKPMFYLFDFIDQVYPNKIKYGFNEKYFGYNSKEQTIKFMKANGMTNFKYLDAQTGVPLTTLSNIDIVISLLSWGYHYTVDTYIDQIIPIMSDDGVLIMDVREKTNGIQTLAKYFSSVKIIVTENKADKVIAKGIKW